jgi:hypothetical protein
MMQAQLNQLEKRLWEDHRCTIEHSPGHTLEQRFATANKVLNQFLDMRAKRDEQLTNLQSLFF